MKKQYHPIEPLLTLTIVVMTLIGGLFIMRRDALTCPLCWKEGLWLVKRWLEEKILFRPKEVLCNRGRLCKSNLVQIALAIKLYASDHGGSLPDHRYWKEQTLDYLRNLRIYRCPDAPAQQISYCMNPQLSGKNMREILAPKETILLFECDANSNPIVRHHFLEFRHLCNVAFVDGHVEGLTLDEVHRKLFGKLR